MGEREGGYFNSLPRLATQLRGLFRSILAPPRSKKAATDQKNNKSKILFRLFFKFYLGLF